MTRTTNARVAGIAFLAYIAIGIPTMVLLGRATRGDGVAAQLARVADHVPEMRASIVLTLLMALAALVLGATFYALTRDVDPDLALLGFACRVGEGVLGAFPITILGLLWLATVRGADAPDPAAARATAAFLLKAGEWKTTIGATMFAVGSALFSWLLLRGRMVPAGLAWLGVFASIVLALALPLRLVGIMRGEIVQALWIPMALFEIPLALWFIVKGVRPSLREVAK